MIKITELPFNSFIGIERSTKNGYVLSLPEDVNYTNHLGTVYASALIALAEATSGEYLISLSNRIEFETIPVVRRIETKFKRPALGRVNSVYKIEKNDEFAFLESLKTKGRSIVSIETEVHDENEAVALIAKIDWFVSKK